jgi:hypothetical protein
VAPVLGQLAMRYPRLAVSLELAIGWSTLSAKPYMS